MRLDQFLVHRFNIKSRSQASDLIARGLVLVNQKVAKKLDLKSVKQILSKSRMNHRLSVAQEKN
jgi:predicted rRNA methylase YqxC with S4 and FtsJ domains